jgi:N-acylglucosamine-6-phosphate 2-epimerase
MVQVLMLNKLKNGLIVSCQAPAGSPLRKPGLMKEFALAAEAGGACAIRAEGIADIKDIAAAVKIPVIGLIKKKMVNSPIYITPELSDIELIIDAGADIVAFDATLRTRPDNLEVSEFIAKARELAVNKYLMADIDDLTSGLAAANSGVDLISTTLSGYTNDFLLGGPDLDLISSLHKNVDKPIIAEGRYVNPLQVSQAITAGAWAVCVGKAITDPWSLTKDFVQAISST